MISSNDFRPGVTIELNGDPCQVVEFQHVKRAKALLSSDARSKT